MDATGAGLQHRRQPGDVNCDIVTQQRLQQWPGGQQD
jgi:hypothetical protein